MKPTWERDGIALYLGDCLQVLPSLSGVDAVVTDPPYLTSEAKVPIVGRGAGRRILDTNSVGNPWGYSLDWIDAISPARHWLIYCNYRMLGGVCSRLEPSAVFVWRKSNAPRMTRPVPRLDCEFIVWSRLADCARMGEFDSLVIDVPMPQAGCFATERILEPGTGRAAHPCQKPLAVVEPFVDRMECKSIVDPFMGTGTTIVASIRQGCERAIGIESDPVHFATARDRIEREMDSQPLIAELEQRERQMELIA